MIAYTSIFKSRYILDYIGYFLLQRTSRIQHLVVKEMDETMASPASKATSLLQRLKEAERRAKLLKSEIKDIRLQIASLTQSTNSILSECGTSSSSNFIRNAHTLASSSTSVSTAQKRQIEEPDSSDVNQPKRTKEDLPMENGYVVLYTDGACENNGKPNAKAGIGVWFSDGHHLNISEPVQGRATNNVAEIQAPMEALKVLKNLGHGKVKILTDSQFTINCMTKWIKKWKSNHWKLAGGGPVKNKDDLVKLDNLCQDFQDIKWEYCAGHRGIKGNEEADKLAREGALRYKK